MDDQAGGRVFASDMHRVIMREFRSRISEIKKIGKADSIFLASLDLQLLQHEQSYLTLTDAIEDAEAL